MIAQCDTAPIPLHCHRGLFAQPMEQHWIGAGEQYLWWPDDRSPTGRTIWCTRCWQHFGATAPVGSDLFALAGVAV